MEVRRVPRTRVQAGFAGRLGCRRNRTSIPPERLPLLGRALRRHARAGFAFCFELTIGSDVSAIAASRVFVDEAHAAREPYTIVDDRGLSARRFVAPRYVAKAFVTEVVADPLAVVVGSF